MTALTQVIYRDEFVKSLEQRQSYLRDTVTTQTMEKGGSLVFLVTGVAEDMRQRGVDGRIPFANETDVQVPITLREMHHKSSLTGFDIFAGQSDTRRILQERGMAAANKQIDDTIITALTAASNTYGGGTVTNTANKVVDLISELFENDIDESEMVTCVWTPKQFAKLRTFSQLASSDFVEKKVTDSGTWIPFNAFGARHVMSNRLPGKGTSTASNFCFARCAVGHAIDAAKVRIGIGFNEEDDYSFARHTLYHEAKILQQAGVFKVVTDDTAAL